MLENFKQNRTITGKPLAPELAADIVKAYDRFPETKLAFVFADDLPDYDEAQNIEVSLIQYGHTMIWGQLCDRFTELAKRRKSALLPILAESFNNLTAAQKITNDFRHSTLGTMTSCWGDVYQSSLGDKTDYTKGFFFYEAPGFAGMLLPTTTISSAKSHLISSGPFSAYVHTSQDPVSIMRSKLAHELEHLDIYTNKPHQSFWTHELLADRAGINVLQLNDDKMAIKVEIQDRALDNMFLQVNQRCAIYWNQLTQLSTPDLSSVYRHSNGAHHADVVAMLEVKQRSAAYLCEAPFIPSVIRNEPDEILNCFNSESHKGFREVYKFQGREGSIRAFALVHALGRVVEDGEYTHPGSRQIAELTLEAAHAFLPEVMHNTQHQRALRDKPAFLAA